ncbi:hypothetical protein L7F22_002336 [Adiantum nelumboides]|nr:hypothetical protein [Adiantum nelumboides]
MADVDHSLYVHKINAKIVVITMHVDYLIIGGDALKDVEHVKALLCKQFDMKDLGELHCFLGIEMIRNEGGIWLLQKKYGLDMLMSYGMADCNPIFTSLDQNLKLRIDEGEVLDDATMYCRIVGSLIYMTISWPNLRYAVGLVIMPNDQGQELPKLALIGSGLFARGQYVPRLREVQNLVSLSTVWSRTEEAAKSFLPLVKDFALSVEARWGVEGLQSIFQDKSIQCVVVVVAAQAQVEITLQALRAGKHVLQEKPASSSVSEAIKALSIHASLNGVKNAGPIWAVAENYRFEPGLAEAARVVKEEIGEMMNVEVIAEAPMNKENPYFSTAWRQEFYGGFTLDMGVHFVAALRMVVGSDVHSLAALSQHIVKTLPPPDNISVLLKLENGCIGVFVMSMSATSRKMIWRVVGSKGTMQVERGVQDGQHGYLVTVYPSVPSPRSSFYPFSGVHEELTAFAEDVANVSFKGMAASRADKRSSPLEGARDVAVIEAILKSSSENGAWVNVPPIP